MEWQQMLGIPDLGGALRKLGNPDSPVSFEHFSHLTPSGISVSLLILLDHLGSETSRHPPPGIQIQFMYPIIVGLERSTIAGEQESLRECVPRAIERRNDHRICILQLRSTSSVFSGSRRLDCVVVA